jgi:hypothetical protein
MNNNTINNDTLIPEIKNTSFSNWIWNTTYNFIQSRFFRLGWIIINIHSSFVIIYNNSRLKPLITCIYNSITPANSVEVVYSIEKFKFFIYTRNRIYKKIVYEKRDEIDYSTVIPIKDIPFISVEIMIERNLNNEPVTTTDGINTKNRKNNIEVYEIKFRTPTYDYYVENNEFNHDFIQWFMKYHYNVSIIGSYYTIHVMRRHDFQNIVFVKGDNIVLRNHLKK